MRDCFAELIEMRGFFGVSIALLCFLALLELNALQSGSREKARQLEGELIEVEKAYYADLALKQGVLQAFDSVNSSRIECATKAAENLRLLELEVERDFNGFQVDVWFGFATDRELGELLDSDSSKCADCFDFNEGAIDFYGNETLKAVMVLDCENGKAFVSRSGLSFLPEEAREFNSRLGNAMVGALLSSGSMRRVVEMKQGFGRVK